VSPRAVKIDLVAKVLVCSDGVMEGTREDRAGPKVVERLTEAGFAVVDHRVCSDGIDEVAFALRDLVAGFAGLVVTTGGTGFGPRDLTPGSTMDNVGGSMYWATTAELQSAIPGIPQEYGLRGSVFVDAGSVFRYTGPTTFGTQSVQVANNNVMRSSVGVGLTWASPFGALTINYAEPLTKASYDVVQRFNFTTGPF